MSGPSGDVSPQHMTEVRVRNVTSGKLEPTLSPYLLWMWYVL